MFTVAGRMIGHSFLHCGPSFPGLSPAIIHILFGGSLETTPVTIRDCPDLDIRDILKMVNMKNREACVFYYKAFFYLMHWIQHHCSIQHNLIYVCCINKTCFSSCLISARWRHRDKRIRLRSSALPIVGPACTKRHQQEMAFRKAYLACCKIKVFLFTSLQLLDKFVLASNEHTKPPVIKYCTVMTFREKSFSKTLLKKTVFAASHLIIYHVVCRHLSARKKGHQSLFPFKLQREV